MERCFVQYSFVIPPIFNTWWRHQMENVSRHWPFVRGIHRSSVNSPRKGQRRGALMLFLISDWINIWVNNREAGDLRRHRAHCDVIYGLPFASSKHYDIKIWKHFPGYWPFVRGFASQRPVTLSFDVFFDLRLNKRLSKQARRRSDSIALFITSL